MLRILAVSIIALLLSVVTSAAFELVYPVDGSAVVNSNYLILKMGQDPVIEGVTVKINGIDSDLFDVSSPEYQAKFGDILILLPDWDAGVNQVEIAGYVAKKEVAEIDAVIYFAKDYTKPVPEAYTPFKMHLPEREALCTGCHNMKPTEAEMEAPDPAQNACASCHQRMLVQSHVHGPAGAWSCTYCHQPDSRPAKYQAREGDAELCLECHQDKYDSFRANKYLHGPIEAGLCMVCHSPHASEQKAQLELPVNELCLECHSRVAKSQHVVRGPEGKGHPLKGPVDPANSFREFNCASCHNPHAGDAKALFNFGVKSRMVLCTKCHAK